MATETLTPDQFHDILRTFVRRKPFHPFVIELRGREPVFVDDPEALAFDGGAAGFIGAKEIYFFNCEEVQDIRPAAQGASS